MYNYKDMEKFCSPSRYFNDGKSCMTLNELQMIAKDLNKHLPKQRRISMRLKKDALHTAIMRAMYPSCQDKEYCWIEHDFLSPEHKARIEAAFRPKKPSAWLSNPRTWLNTYDILHVLKPYENLYKDFAFLGVHPIDFQSTYANGQCIGDQLCSFHIRSLLDKKIKRFAFVLNLDRHDQSGSHWVAVYCGLDPKKPNFGVYYYDSVAHEPGPEVVSFMKQMYIQVQQVFPSSIGKTFALKFNQVQKQFKNTECGMFSIVFITQCLKHRAFKDICLLMRKDDAIQELRDVLYRPSLKAT